MRSWGLSTAEQDEVWVRWRQGESLRLIARRLGKRGPSVPDSWGQMKSFWKATLGQQ